MSEQDIPQLTATQRRWWERFKRTMDAMPEGIELYVMNGTTAIWREGDFTTETLESSELKEIDWHFTPRLEPWGESM